MLGEKVEGRQMDKPEFRIAEDAAEYLRKYLLRSDTGESLILSIVPMTSQSKSLGNVDPKKMSDRKLAALAKEYLESLPSPIEFEWVVGGMQRSSLPAAAERSCPGNRPAFARI